MVGFSATTLEGTVAVIWEFDNADIAEESQLSGVSDVKDCCRADVS